MGAIEPAQHKPTTAPGVHLPANSSDLARATIRQLALRRLPPTPANYASLYAELSGEEVAPKSGEEVAAKSGAEVHAGGADRWGGLVRELIRTWDIRSPDWTQARKRESLEHVACAFGADDDKLAVRLRALIKSWSARGSDARAARLSDDVSDQAAVPLRSRNDIGALAPANAAQGSTIGIQAPSLISAPAGSSRAPGADPHAEDACALLRDLAIDLLIFAIGEDGGGDERLIAQAGQLIQSLRSASNSGQLALLAPKIRMLMRRAEQVRGSQREILQSLLGLLHLIVSNIEELVPDERWVRGQVERLRGLIAGPLDGESLAEAAKAFREIIVKQSSIKQNIRAAQAAMKDMLAGFIGRLSSMSESTGQYQSKVEIYSRQIKGAEDIGSLSAVVQALLEDTRLAQADILRGHDELVDAQRRARQYEEQVGRLERELSDVSSLLREDPLTGVLNRRGLAEAFVVEAARSDRAERPLCLALLDVDNFKKINDTHGHDSGDKALQHLADIIREAIRPTDVVARFGGEEFIVLMPQTDADEAVQIMTRVQRQLTRGFFLGDNQKLLITFSAGVTRRALDEDQSTVIARADQALYEAKATGKNKVIFI